MTDRGGLDRNRERKGDSPGDHSEKQEGTNPWGVALSGLLGFGATAAFYSWKTGQLLPMLHRFNRFFGFSQQIKNKQSSWNGGASRLFERAFEEQTWRKYDQDMERVIERFRKSAAFFRDFSQQINTGQFSFKWEASREEAQRKHQKRMQEMYEDEMERVERIRRMQSVFNRERNKNRRSYESWNESSNTGSYHQHSQREDWYWKADASFKDKKFNYGESPRTKPNYTLSHHYAVLGLNRSPANPYTEAEIKSAFRAKAMQFHPDQNQDNKEVGEAKFKEILASYEAIRSERKT